MRIDNGEQIDAVARNSMKGVVHRHGMVFQWEFNLSPLGQAGYKLRVSFGDLDIHRDYPAALPRTRAEREAVRLAGKMLGQEERTPE